MSPRRRAVIKEPDTLIGRYAHRVFAAYEHAHNARLDGDLYGQRWMAEAAFSAIKRRFGPADYPRAWYREFREIVR
jgi:IS5 family transposase